MATVSPPAASLKPMMGGAAFQKSFQEWRLANSNLYSAVSLLLLIVLALFSAEVPPIWRAQANTILGRLLLVVALYVLYDVGGWPLATMGLIGISLLIAPTREVLPEPESLLKPVLMGGVKEGFSADVVAIRDVDTKQSRWFVERLFKERPTRIEEDRVLTQGNSS